MPDPKQPAEGFHSPLLHDHTTDFAGNDSEGLALWAIETSEKYYLTWKEERESERESEDEGEHLLDKQLLQLCEKQRLLKVCSQFSGLLCRDEKDLPS